MSDRKLVLEGFRRARRGNIYIASRGEKTLRVKSEIEAAFSQDAG